MAPTSPVASSSSSTSKSSSSASTDAQELFRAFYAMVRHNNEPQIVERIRRYVADGGDLNVRDKTGWGFINVRGCLLCVAHLVVWLQK